MAYIGEYAFEACSGLTTITIPSSVTSIGDDAFDGCSGLEAAAETMGFATVAEWGRYCCVGRRRVSARVSVRVYVLACVGVTRRQLFYGLGQEEPVSELLQSMAVVPDDVLRVNVGFMGEVWRRPSLLAQKS